MKEKLLAAVRDTRVKERELEALSSDAPADPSGRWSPKDHLAHLAWWRDRNATLIDAVRTGGQLPPSVDDEEQNAAIYQSMRDRSAPAVIGDARRAWDLLVATLEACSEADMNLPHPYDTGRKLVDGSPGDHLGAHLMWAYLDLGDAGGAERAQLWARDLSARTYSDPRSRAVADYNLACFYSRVGRPDEAIPLLRGSFEGAPELKEWSRKDPDLDPIRSELELKELLAT